MPLYLSNRSEFPLDITDRCIFMVSTMSTLNHIAVNVTVFALLGQQATGLDA